MSLFCALIIILECGVRCSTDILLSGLSLINGRTSNRDSMNVTDAGNLCCTFSSGVQLENCRIESSEHDGIRLFCCSEVIINSCEITGNNVNGIRSASSSLIASGCKFNRNGNSNDTALSQHSFVKTGTTVFG